jgi:hypothetical protein
MESATRRAAAAAAAGTTTIIIIKSPNTTRGEGEGVPVGFHEAV